MCDRGRAERRERAVVAERPRRARRARVGAAHVRAGEQEHERADRGRQDQRGPRRTANARREGGPAHLDRKHGEHREKDLGVREMRRDPGVRQFEEDHDRAEERLHDVQDARPRRRSVRARRCSRYRAIVTAPSAARLRPPAIAMKRWNHSMRVCGSRPGRNCPWQSGQSGQPRPEPVTRTIPPHTTTRNMRTSVM